MEDLVERHGPLILSALMKKPVVSVFFSAGLVINVS